jgi:hypothetical protein
MWRLSVGGSASLVTFLCSPPISSSASSQAGTLGHTRAMGLVSELYMYLYYGSDLVLAVAVYLVILELQRPLLPAQFCRILRRCSLAIVSLWTVVSYAEIWRSNAQRLMFCAYELATNLWFVSLGLILLLWVFMYLRDLRRGIAAEMVRVWGIYFLLMGSGNVFFYFFHNLSPSAPRLHLEVPVMAEV